MKIWRGSSTNYNCTILTSQISGFRFQLESIEGLIWTQVAPFTFNEDGLMAETFEMKWGGKHEEVKMTEEWILLQNIY